MYQQFNLLFYKGNSFLGRIIKCISSGKYSHVSMFLDPLHTLETSWKNPSVIKHFDYKKKDVDIYEFTIDISDKQKEKILNYIVEHVETGYDFIYLLSRGLHLIFGTKVYNSKKYFDCDELIVDAFRHAGIHLMEIDADLSPSTFADSKCVRKISK